MASARRGSAASFADLRREFKADQWRTCYLFEGEDTHRMAAMIEFLKKKVLGEAGVAFNYHVYDGGDTPLATALQQAFSFPLMCDKQVIWIKRVDEAVSGTDAEEGLLRYLADPSPQTILLATAVKLDGRKKWVKEFKASGCHFDFSPPSGAELIQWVKRKAAEQELELDEDLAVLLVELVGDDLNALQNEIAKLSLLVDNGTEILSSDRLREVIMSQRAVDIFELVKNLGPGKAPNGLRVYHKFLAEGRSPYELAPLLAWRVKQIAMVNACRSEGLADRDIMSRTGLSPYAFRAVDQAVRSWGGKSIGRALAACAECDSAVKSSPLGPEIVLERAILAICADG